MFREMGKYGAGLIALYLIVAKGSNFGTVVKAGADGASEDVMALQGRSK